MSVSSIATLTAGNSATVLAPVVSLKPGGGVGKPSNGMFAVKFRETGTGPIYSGYGVFIQKTGTGAGYFLKSGETGSVLLGP